jgi:hypothetical protein
MRLSGGDKAGLYITAIIHLAVIIILLLLKIDAVGSTEFYVLDYTDVKAPEIKKKPEQPRQVELSREELERIIAAASNGDPEALKSIAVNAGLKDDRGTNAEELYKEHERILREIREGQKNEPKEDDRVETGGPEEDKGDSGQTRPYSGPSVLSWELEGRQAVKLPIPAYRCYGAGDVTVIITVNAIGQVTAAKVDDLSSSSDGCLRQRSLEAARQSKFSRDDARETQMGTIVYRFIAQ